jgi:hypothetical protein
LTLKKVARRVIDHHFRLAGSRIHKQRVIVLRDATLQGFKLVVKRLGLKRERERQLAASDLGSILEEFRRCISKRRPESAKEIDI